MSVCSRYAFDIIECSSILQQEEAGTMLDDWLRNQFFEQHCKRFHHRPFIWHIWDGRKDGFSCLVNYHKLDYKALENLVCGFYPKKLIPERQLRKWDEPSVF